jgi:hypothetical protein
MFNRSDSPQEFARTMRACIELERQLFHRLHEQFVDPGIKEQVSHDARELDYLAESLFRSEQILRDSITRDRLIARYRYAVGLREGWQETLNKYGRDAIEICEASPADRA